MEDFSTKGRQRPRHEGSLKDSGRNHQGTIGGSLAAMHLDRMLIEHDDARLFYKVTQILNRWSAQVGLISEIPNQAFRQEVMSAFRPKVRDQILALQDCPLDIRTHACNVASAYAKKAMKEWRTGRKDNRILVETGEIETGTEEV